MSSTRIVVTGMGAVTPLGYGVETVWQRLLAGRSAQLLVTMDSPPWYYRWVQGMPGHRQMQRTILEFSGIRPVRVHSLGPVRSASAARRAHWLQQAQHWGQVQGRQCPRKA